MNTQTAQKEECPRIRTIDDLLSQIKYLHRRYNEHLWFRGQRDSSWGLMPSIQRYNLPETEERHITNDFRIRASQVMENAPSRKEYSAWMAHMQHYGLPTRMLDWTKSPLIAAFFAVESNATDAETDSCIWALRPGLLNRIEIGDSSLYPVDSGTAERMLQPAFTDNPVGDDRINDKMLACYSVQNNLRMYSQQSCFTIHNTRRLLTDIIQPDLLFKFIIPVDVRDAFRYDLQIFGITRGFVYPDLDNISRDLRSRYGM